MHVVYSADTTAALVPAANRLTRAIMVAAVIHPPTTRPATILRIPTTRRPLTAPHMVRHMALRATITRIRVVAVVAAARRAAIAACKIIPGTTVIIRTPMVAITKGTHTRATIIKTTVAPVFNRNDFPANTWALAAVGDSSGW